MGKKSELTSEERAQIDILRQANPQWSGSRIGQEIGRHGSTITRYLKNPENYGQSPRSGRPKAISEYKRRRISGLAANQMMTAGRILTRLNLNCDVRTVQRVLAADPHIIWTKMVPKPKLDERHKTARFEFAKKFITLIQIFNRIVFTDEKKFNLDGPDGSQYYWHDLRKEKKYLSKRRFGGGSVMVWAGFGINGTTDIVFLDGNVNSYKYCDVIGDNLLPIGPLIADDPWILQQDNATIHTSEESRGWFEVNSVEVLEWPSCSPDLNPIENLWGWLVRRVYHNGRQFDNKDQLKEAIRESWREVPGDLLKSLISSMKDRLIDVIAANGGSTKY